MSRLYDQATANDSQSFTRSNRGVGGLYVQGKFKYYKTGTGTATLNLYDEQTQEQIATLSVPATDGEGNGVEVNIPETYRADIVSVTGSVSITVWMDGDAP